jgi:MFS family permease
MFITRGRRICLIVFNLLAAMAVSMTLVLNLHMIIIGRFLFGFCCGVFSVAGPKMLDETVPVNLISKFGTATNSI